MEIDQISKNNTYEESKNPQVKKQKDPKKVAAGKVLAKNNAEGRKLRLEASRKQDEELNSNSSQVDVSTIYNEIQSIAGIVGTGFTLYHGWKFYESFRKNEVGDKEPTSRGSPPATPATPSVPPKIKRNHPVDF